MYVMYVSLRLLIKDLVHSMESLHTVGSKPSADPRKYVWMATKPCPDRCRAPLNLPPGPLELWVGFLHFHRQTLCHLFGAAGVLFGVFWLLTELLVAEQSLSSACR